MNHPTTISAEHDYAIAFYDARALRLRGLCIVATGKALIDTMSATNEPTSVSLVESAAAVLAGNAITMDETGGNGAAKHRISVRSVSIILDVEIGLTHHDVLPAQTVEPPPA